jgi:hypothetical protein
MVIQISIPLLTRDRQITPTDDSHALDPALLSDSTPLKLGLSQDSLDSSSFPQSSSGKSKLKFTGPKSLWSAQPHDAPPASPLGSSPDHVPFPPESSKSKFLSELLSVPTHDTSPPDGSPQMVSSPEEHHSSTSYVPSDSPSTSSTSSSSWESTDYSSSSTSSLSSNLKSDESYPGSPGALSTDEYQPPTSRPTNNRPQPVPPSNPGPSTESNPPPRAKRPRPEEDENWVYFKKLFKGTFKRRFFGPGGALNAAQGYLQV